MKDIQKITIAGGGTTGYLTAFHMAKTYPDKEITWYFPEDNNPIGVGEALVPKTTKFMDNLGITTKDIIKHCNGALKLGIRFRDFNQIGEHFDFPFGQGEAEQFNTSAIKFMMDHNKIPDNICDYPDISVHWRAVDILKYMDTLTYQFTNIKIIRQSTTLVELAGTYDLLIDCSGFAKKFSDWPNNFKTISDKIPNNKAYSWRGPYTDKSKQMFPGTVAQAMDHGWIWQISLGDQLALGYVHDSKYDVKQEFIDYIENYMGVKVDPGEIDTIHMRTGRNIDHIKNNIVAIGLSACFVEPLESSGIWLTTEGILTLCKYIDGKIDEHTYSDHMNRRFDWIVDFLVAHYKYSKRNNKYWNFYKNVEFEKHVDTEIGMFSATSWDFILSGFLDDVSPPREKVDVKELIKIQKSLTYAEWLEHARTSST
jgi:tryptophan halogenase